MTDALADFLSWFDGFSENIETAPNEKQWARVKERIAKIRTGAVGSPQVTAPAGVPNPPPAADPALLDKLAKMKQQGKTAAAPGGQAMSAGV